MNFSALVNMKLLAIRRYNAKDAFVLEMKKKFGCYWRYSNVQKADLHKRDRTNKAMDVRGETTSYMAQPRILQFSRETVCCVVSDFPSFRKRYVI